MLYLLSQAEAVPFLAKVNDGLSTNEAKRRTKIFLKLQGCVSHLSLLRSLQQQLKRLVAVGNKFGKGDGHEVNNKFVKFASLKAAAYAANEPKLYETARKELTSTEKTPGNAAAKRLRAQTDILVGQIDDFEGECDEAVLTDAEANHLLRKSDGTADAEMAGMVALVRLPPRTAVSHLAYCTTRLPPVWQHPHLTPVAIRAQMSEHGFGQSTLDRNVTVALELVEAALASDSTKPDVPPVAGPVADPAVANAEASLRAFATAPMAQDAAAPAGALARFGAQPMPTPNSTQGLDWVAGVAMQHAAGGAMAGLAVAPQSVPQAAPVAPVAPPAPAAAPAMPSAPTTPVVLDMAPAAGGPQMSAASSLDAGGLVLSLGGGGGGGLVSSLGGGRGVVSLGDLGSVDLSAILKSASGGFGSRKLPSGGCSEHSAVRPFPLGTGGGGGGGFGSQQQPSGSEALAFVAVAMAAQAASDAASAANRAANAAEASSSAAGDLGGQLEGLAAAQSGAATQAAANHEAQLKATATAGAASVAASQASGEQAVAAVEAAAAESSRQHEATRSMLRAEARRTRSATVAAAASAAAAVAQTAVAANEADEERHEEMLAAIEATARAPTSTPASDVSSAAAGFGMPAALSTIAEEPVAANGAVEAAAAPAAAPAPAVTPRFMGATHSSELKRKAQPAKRQPRKRSALSPRSGTNVTN